MPVHSVCQCIGAFSFSGTGIVVRAGTLKQARVATVLAAAEGLRVAMVPSATLSLFAQLAAVTVILEDSPPVGYGDFPLPRPCLP